MGDRGNVFVVDDHAYSLDNKAAAKALRALADGANIEKVITRSAYE